MKRRSSTSKQKKISKEKGFGSFVTQNSIQQDINNQQEQQQNDDDDQYKLEKQPYYLKQKYQKNYRKFDQKGIRKVKIIAYECLKSMKLKGLFEYWSKKQEGQRNKRYIILLIIMIVANEKQSLMKDFLKKYKKLCSEIIQRKNPKFQQDYNSQNFQSIKHHLQISIKASQAFIESDFDVDIGLKIMQNESQPKYYLSAKKKLEEYKQIIKNNKHKKNQKKDEQI